MRPPPPVRIAPGPRSDRSFPPIDPRKRYRCRYCGDDFPAALPVTHAPNGTTLLHHLAAMHREVVGPYLRRMEAGECITAVVVEVFAVVEGDEPP